MVVRQLVLKKPHQESIQCAPAGDADDVGPGASAAARNCAARSRATPWWNRKARSDMSPGESNSMNKSGNDVAALVVPWA